jgi:hypothetical protein
VGANSKKRAAVFLATGIVGWGLCGAIMGIGMQIASLETTLLVHAAGAPAIFFAVSLPYFSYAARASALKTAIAYVLLVISMDFLVVALLINKSLDMFRNPLGTWIPFALIFAAVLAAGGWRKRAMDK